MSVGLLLIDLLKRSVIFQIIGTFGLDCYFIILPKTGGLLPFNIKNYSLEYLVANTLSRREMGSLLGHTIVYLIDMFWKGELDTSSGLNRKVAQSWLRDNPFIQYMSVEEFASVFQSPGIADRDLFLVEFMKPNHDRQLIFRESRIDRGSGNSPYLYNGFNLLAKGTSVACIKEHENPHPE